MDVEHKIKEIPIKEIYVGDNSRLEIEKEDLADLMDSIKQQGLLQAIGVVKLSKEKGGKKYKIIYGNRRLAAFKKLRKRIIPARIHEDAQELADQIILNLVENDQRRDIDAFEFGRSCVYLKDQLNYTLKEIAVALSTSIPRIKCAMDIYKQIPEEYAGRIKTMPYGSTRGKGTIPSTMARTVVQMKRKYSLKKHQVKEIMDFVAISPDMPARALNSVMYFMSQGVSLRQALKKVNDVVIKRYEVSIEKEEVEKLETKYGSLANAIQQIIYTSGEVKDPRGKKEVFGKSRQDFE